MSDYPANIDIALRAFALFTVPDQLRALELCCALSYPRIADRLEHAVYTVIQERRGDNTEQP